MYVKSAGRWVLTNKSDANFTAFAETSIGENLIFSAGWLMSIVHNVCAVQRVANCVRTLNRPRGHYAGGEDTQDQSSRHSCSLKTS